MVTFNSSVNLFIYCGFGKKFRREFKKLLGLKVDTEIEVVHDDSIRAKLIFFYFAARNNSTKVLEEEASNWKRDADAHTY